MSLIKHLRYYCSCSHSLLFFTGIIASKRCTNVEIYNNEVYDGQQAGIFLHRSTDNAKVYSKSSQKSTQTSTYAKAISHVFCFHSFSSFAGAG